jgi:hypothetical protein
MASFFLPLGAWLSHRAVNPYRSLVNQMDQLSEHQKHNLSDEIRHTVGSSSIDSLFRYVSNLLICP